MPGFDRTQIMRLGKRRDGRQLPLIGNNLVQQCAQFTHRQPLSRENASIEV